MKNLKFLFTGMLFGIILVKAEVISWFRIQEMFRLESFHMYGVIGSAVFTAMLGVLLIRKMGWRSVSGEEIVVQKKPFTKGNIIGGLIFGLGWAITGACPGPIFAQIGSGFTVVIVTFLSAVAGTWVYGKWKDHLPH
ncbi:DUF6691 family protein [Chitinophaga deserti]|uniref:DUF6691 family protein n=1 Tax=Chitinophaga deserti TaxID=2164099 RepID=UPI000D6A8887|nr:DUF6691 family protein [Chitinophaga deserti]